MGARWLEEMCSLSLSLSAMMQECEGLPVHNVISPLVCSLDADVCQDLLKPLHGMFVICAIDVGMHCLTLLIGVRILMLREGRKNWKDLGCRVHLAPCVPLCHLRQQYSILQ